MEQQTKQQSVTPCGCAAGIAICVALVLFILPSFNQVYFGLRNSGYYNSDDYQLLEAARSGNLAIAKELLENGADVNRMARGHRGKSPLAIAVLMEDDPMIELLLESGADVWLDHPGGNALFSAVRLEDKEMFGMLLDHLDDPNPHGAEEWTPLWTAVLADWPEYIEILLERGADPGNNGASLTENLEQAIEQDQPAIARLLIEAGANVNYSKGGYSLLLVALHEKVNPEIIIALIEGGADVDVHGPVGKIENGIMSHTSSGNDYFPNGKYPLHLAAISGDESVYKALIEAGADIESLDWREATPLIYASQKMNTTGVKLLVEAGANVNHCTSAGQFPLHVAAVSGNLSNAKLLVELGADVNSHRKPNSKYDKDLTALGYASSECLHVEVVKYLLENGADPLIADEKGITPLQYLLDNPPEYAHPWEGHEDTCSLDQLNARRKQLIVILQQYE